MNPNPNPYQSTITSFVLWLSGVAVSWAVAKGFVASGDQATIVGDLSAIALAGIGLAIGWWKAHQTTQTVLVKAVNEADNGVTVVPTVAAVAAGIPQATVPLK